MVVIEHGYVGLAPVPGGRINVGIVLGRPGSRACARDGAAAVARAILERVRPASEAAAERPVLDRVAGASPLGAGARRRAGPGWVLVGDAAGFLDPFTGEGLHRAIVSAELAAAAIRDVARRPAPATWARTTRACAGASAPRTWSAGSSQAFLGRPAVFEYAARRLAARPELRETMGLVIGDLLPASRALDPRYLAGPARSVKSSLADLDPRAGRPRIHLVRMSSAGPRCCPTT